MKSYKFIVLSFVLLMLCACVEEVGLNVNPQSGADVQFGLSLGKLADTRTIYGDETGNGFPIYWVDGDKVLIASPQCVDGRNSAEYMVSCSTATQNWADALTRTGDAGIQWGETSPADFYSIYPSAGSTLQVNNDGKSVSAQLQVAATQYAKTEEKNNVIYAQPNEMGNVIMYAYSPGVQNDGNPVQLKYKPFSTVIEFEILAPASQASGTQVKDIVIQSLTLTAPVNIAGQFTFNFPQSTNGTPTVTNISGSKDITVHFLEGDAYATTLTYGKSLKAKMCLVPISDVASMVDWKITVATSAGNFTKTIGSNSDINTALQPGKVHKISLPRLEYANKEWEYDNNDWITSLPDYRNIYLTEISLPGAWYAGSPETYQATSNIKTLWDAGVRAFAVETKTMSGTGSYLSNGSQPNPNGVVVSGLGGNGTPQPGGRNSLRVNEQGEMIDGPSGKVYRLFRGLLDGQGTRLREIIEDVAAEVTEKEYGVLVLSYADGGDSGLRYVDYGAWLQMLYEEFYALAPTVKDKIYQNAINENTIINDVLGKLIIKVNVDANIARSGSVYSGNTLYEYSYADNLPALFSYNPFVSQIGDFSKPYYSSLYWKTWSDSNRKLSNEFDGAGFTWCFSSANRTQVNPTGSASANATIPTYEQRQTALESMMDKSKEVYDASTHNVWFYFNCGGTEATSATSESPKPSPTEFAKVMNKWLKELVENKNTKEEASPLGIVMFNQCTGDNATYYGEDIIKAIIEMNSKFYLKHAGEIPGGTTATSEVQSVSNRYSAAVVDNGTNAIGWE